VSREWTAEEIKAEARRVVRHFSPYTSEQRADRAASHRLGHRQRTSPGEFFYTHPDVPGVGYPRRYLAVWAALQRKVNDSHVDT
jgi:hypothetical protein